MKIIKLTLLNNTPVYVNVNHIGHILSVEEKSSDNPKHTKVGVTTHNNGGLKVYETVEEILKMIKI